MEKNVELSVRRFNIYSCLTVKIGNLEVCFDPAKIRKEDLDKIHPDMIFISHESMDHMEPAQVYFLQKKRSCKVFCSIAAATDLIQYFPQDIDFVENVIPLTPGCELLERGVHISTGNSIHCDYMMPLVFKLCFLDANLSLLHCFDTHLSEEIIELSKETDIAIIPIGIAKGVCANTGLEFSQKLHSRFFITNHFKDETDLEQFHQLIQKKANKDQFFLVDWNNSCRVNVVPKYSFVKKEQNISVEKIYDSINRGELSTQDLKSFLVHLGRAKANLLNDQKLIDRLFSCYPALNRENKKILLVIGVFISLIDTSLIQESFISLLKEDLLGESVERVNGLKVVVLFFLGIYSQQAAKIFYHEEVRSSINDPYDHVNYWIVEFLGRTATCKGEGYELAIEDLIHIIQIPNLYTSVVVRRKLFWELYRIMKAIPYSSNRFMETFEDGLVDGNPDVRLLATLCFALANRIYNLSPTQIDKIFNLFEDPEDDVRETAVKVVGALRKNHPHQIKKRLNEISELLEDRSCHVQFAAQETYALVN